jgi:nucleoside-diphosphate-sugar epimerase
MQAQNNIPPPGSGRILLTGASGHLGANLVRHLLARGEAVRCLIRRGSDNSALDGLDVERAYGDLRDADAVRAAAAGCARVYHCAALLSTAPGNEREIYDSNVIGTRNLLRAARAHGAARVVVTGSLSAVGHTPDRPSDEEVPFYPFERHLPYSHTKTLVEHECWKAAAEGLDVVVAISCAIVGPNDFKPSRMGQVMCRVANRKLRAYIPGGFDFVSAADLCEGHVLAMHRGRSGQRYILSTEFMTMDQLMDLYCELSGAPRPPLRLPPALMAGIAEVSTFLARHLTPGRQPLITPAAVRLLRLSRRADTRKAQTELGYRPTSVRKAIEDAYEFFVRRGLITAPGGAQGRAQEKARAAARTGNQAA